MDHLHLVVERIDLDGGVRPGLLAKRLEHLVGRHRRDLDRNRDRLRVGRRGGVKCIADALRELGDRLIEGSVPLEGDDALQNPPE